MSNLELHQYLPQLPDAALQEFIEWCMLEQSTAAGLEFKPDQIKLNNLAAADYSMQLVVQFMIVSGVAMRGGL
ncbi:MAG: hypothetical protein ACK55G_20775, partial [Dolichospermum sp.]